MMRPVDEAWQTYMGLTLPNVKALLDSPTALRHAFEFGYKYGHEDGKEDGEVEGIQIMKDVYHIA